MGSNELVAHISCHLIVYFFIQKMYVNILNLFGLLHMQTIPLYVVLKVQFVMKK